MKCQRWTLDGKSTVALSARLESTPRLHGKDPSEQGFAARFSTTIDNRRGRWRPARRGRQDGTDRLHGQSAGRGPGVLRGQPGQRNSRSRRATVRSAQLLPTVFSVRQKERNWPRPNSAARSTCSKMSGDISLNLQPIDHACSTSWVRRRGSTFAARRSRATSNSSWRDQGVLRSLDAEFGVQDLNPSAGLCPRAVPQHQHRTRS